MLVECRLKIAQRVGEKQRNEISEGNEAIRKEFKAEKTIENTCILNNHWCWTHGTQRDFVLV